MASQVYSTIHASPLITYGIASNPLSPPHDSLVESVTPKGNPKPRNNPPNLLPNVPSDPDLDPSLSYSSLSDSSYSSDYEYHKQRQRAKKYKNKCRSKMRSDDPIKNAGIFHPRYLQPRKNQRSLNSNWTSIPYSYVLFPILHEFT